MLSMVNYMMKRKRLHLVNNECMQTLYMTFDFLRCRISRICYSFFPCNCYKVLFIFGEHVIKKVVSIGQAPQNIFHFIRVKLEQPALPNPLNLDTDGPCVPLHCTGQVGSPILRKFMHKIVKDVYDKAT